MTKDEIAAAAALLVEARRTGQRIEALPVLPATVAEAHAIQDAITARLGETVGAFKANAPAGKESIRGAIYARMIRPSPARIAAAEVPQLGLEGEIAFRLTRDLPAREAAYGRDEVAGALAILPAIEVVSSRFREPFARSPLEQVADSIMNGAFVPGPETRDWSHLDITRLHVTLTVNGETVVDQHGGHPSGDPLAVVVALANMMRGSAGVKASQVVTTGSCTGLRFLKPGDRCTVHFEPLGTAEVAFEG